MRAWQKKLWQLMAMRSKDAFKRIIERMESIMKMEVQALVHEARTAEVNAVMDTVLKAWETSEDESENKAAVYFWYWRKKTGVAKTCCSSQWPVALWQVLLFLDSVICCAAVLLQSQPTSSGMLRTISCKLKAVHADDCHCCACHDT
jgi:hypothetical protein